MKRIKLICVAILLSNIVIKSGVVIADIDVSEPQVESNFQREENINFAAGDIATGKLGTSSWTISSSGVLTIGAGDWSNWPGGEYNVPWRPYAASITSIVIDGPVKAPRDLNLLFWKLPKLTSVKNMGLIDVSNTVTAQLLFFEDSLLTELDFSNWDMSKMDDVGVNKMLQGTTSLRKLTVGPTFRFMNYDWQGNIRSDVSLPNITANSIYTGKWQNIGTGTEDTPTGKNVWTTTELKKNFDGQKDADTYIWQKKSVPAAPVTVRYVNSEGIEIQGSKTIYGNVGEPYDASTDEYKLNISGYILDESQLPNNSIGVLSNDIQTVTYTYKKEIDKTSILAHDSEIVIGDEWNPIDNFDSATDAFGNDLSFTDITVSGTVDTSKAGIYTVIYTNGTVSQTIKVTVKESAPVKVGEVIVHYKDEEGISIASDEILKGNIGENYYSSKKEIKNYLFKEVKGNPIGKFSNQVQTITYVYVKEVVSPVKGTIMVNYVDDKGNTLTAPIIKSGIVGEGYLTEEKKIEGYTFKKIKGNKEGVFTKNTQVITYIYIKEIGETEKDKDKESGGTTISKDINNNSDILVFQSNNDNYTTDVNQTLPKAGEKPEFLNVIVGAILLISVSIFAVLKYRKFR